MVLRALIGCIALASFCFAQDLGGTLRPLHAQFTGVDLSNRQAVALQTLESLVPQFIVGGEWTTTIKLLNRGTAPIQSTSLYFVDSAGNSLPLSFQGETSDSAGRLVKGAVLKGSAANFTLSAGNSMEIAFFGTTDVTFGHVFIGCNSGGCSIPGLYGEAILRNRNSTRPDFESIFPLERPATAQYMAWDHRDGFTSVLYLVSPFTASVVNLELRNAANQLTRALTVPIVQGGAQILTLHALAPETVGLAGTLVINSGSDFVVATGLRINPSNSFTPMRAFIPNLTSSAPIVLAPTVTAISPSTGSTSGGTSVTITGTNFASATSVSIGGTLASFVIVNSTTITATTPPHAAGATSVQVTTPGGTNATNALFTYTSSSPGPLPSFGAGTYRVGSAISAGRYYTVPSSGCYWERLSGLGGTLAEIIANDFLGSVYKQAIVDISATDLAFSTDADCGTWFNTPRLGSQTSIGAGTWLVGTQVAAGTYQATSSSGCYWERLRNFGGLLSAIIANDFISSGGTQFVTITSGDIGFTTTSSCGTWTLISTATSESNQRLETSAVAIQKNRELNRSQHPRLRVLGDAR